MTLTFMGCIWILERTQITFEIWEEEQQGQIKTSTIRTPSLIFQFDFFFPLLTSFLEAVLRDHEAIAVQDED